MQDQSFDLLTSSPACYHCAMDAHLPPLHVHGADRNSIPMLYVNLLVIWYAYQETIPHVEYRILQQILDFIILIMARNFNVTLHNVQHCVINAVKSWYPKEY